MPRQRPITPQWYYVPENVIKKDDERLKFSHFKNYFSIIQDVSYFQAEANNVFHSLSIRNINNTHLENIV